MRISSGELDAEEIQFGIANIAMPLPVMLGYSVAATERYLADIRADGMEVTPVLHSRFLGRMALCGERRDVLRLLPPCGRNKLGGVLPPDLIRGSKITRISLY